MRISDWSSDVCSSDLINGTQDGLRQAFALEDVGLGISVAALLPGCAVGAFAAGRLAAAIGRSAVMMPSALVCIHRALPAGAGHTDINFIFASYFHGLGVGAGIGRASCRARLGTSR